MATPDLALTLFTKQIEPILLYGSCRWEQRLNKCMYAKVDATERQKYENMQILYYTIYWVERYNLMYNVCKTRI